MESLVSNGFLAPPTVFIVLCLVGALLALRLRRAGVALALAASLALYIAAIPACSSYLLQRAEAGLPPEVDLNSAQAIVVLGGDVRAGNGKSIPDRLGPISEERVLYAAQAYRRLHLPVAVSGGAVADTRLSEASLMKSALEADFAVPVTWAEDKSRTTWENAVYTAALLRSEKVANVVLVTQAWHLPRAIWSFDRVGLHPLPWPAPRTAAACCAIGDFLPNIGALHESFLALHELIGGVYYRLRH